MPKTKPTFSVVIPALNEEKYLPQLLDDLAKQSAKDFEVIIVDGNSEDRTVLKAKKFSKQLNLRVRVVKKRNVSHQRNVGGKMAKADWIIFMDADNRLPVSFLDGIRYRLAKNSKIDVFTCLLQTQSDNSQDKIVYRAINAMTLINSKTNKPIVLGAMIGSKKIILDSLKFNTKQKVTEDAFFISSAMKKGANFSVLRDPTYTYNLRRLKKEGVLKMAFIQSQLISNYLVGNSFDTKDYGYSMKGGDYYDQESSLTITSQLSSLKDKLASSTKDQIKKMRNLLSDLDEK